MLDNSIKQYALNLQSARDLETVYIALSAMTANVVPKDELLRAELVSLVSALDTYIHDIVREGLKCYYQNNIANDYVTDFNNKHHITSLEDFESKLREIHGYKTFQAPKRISEALKMLDILDIWNKVAVNISDAEITLNLIVDRRNKIAHESDINPINGLGVKWTIDLVMVQSVVNSIDDIVKCLNTLIRSELRLKGIRC